MIFKGDQKQARRELKAAGYKVSFRTVSFSGLGYGEGVFATLKKGDETYGGGIVSADKLERFKDGIDILKRLHEEAKRGE